MRIGNWEHMDSKVRNVLHWKVRIYGMKNNGEWMEIKWWVYGVGVYSNDKK